MICSNLTYYLERKNMVIFKHCGAIEKCGNFPFLRVCFFVELEISFIINKTLIFGL